MTLIVILKQTDAPLVGPKRPCPSACTLSDYLTRNDKPSAPTIPSYYIRRCFLDPLLKTSVCLGYLNRLATSKFTETTHTIYTHNAHEISKDKKRIVLQEVTQVYPQSYIATAKSIILTSELRRMSTLTPAEVVHSLWVYCVVLR